MKAPASPRAKTSALRLRLAVRHSAASRAVLADRRLRESARRVLQIARRHARYALSLAFVDDRAMRRLNGRFAGNDYTTDVLSFPALEPTAPFAAPPAADVFLGDIVIALPQAARQARAAEHSLAREVDLLVTHGVLHLLGYDHATPAQKRAMDALQARALRR